MHRLLNRAPGDDASANVEAEARAGSRYEVLAKIATGGMATVYVGRVRGAIGFSRLIAIKRPHPFVSDDAALREGLRQEARVASLIHHPNVVSVLDVEQEDDRVDLILDYVEGGTLTDLLKHARETNAPLAARVVVRIILDVASGLHAAHVLRDHAGVPLHIMHRDVSPQNILVGLDGHARLTDFGIAKIATRLERTATDIIKGKMGYLAPEYVENRTFDERSDEYALGVVTWEALAGRRLFKGSSDAHTLRAILDGKAPPLSSASPDLVPLDGVLERALCRDPGARFDSVASFADALEERAREHAWVAPYGEVAAAVEAAVGERIRARRAAVEVSSPGLLADVSGERPRPGSPRDAMATLSLASAAHSGSAGDGAVRPAPKRVAWGVGLLSLLVVGGAAVAIGARHPEVAPPLTPVGSMPAGSTWAAPSASSSSAAIGASTELPPRTGASSSPAVLPQASASSTPPRTQPRPVRRPAVSGSAVPAGSPPGHPRAPAPPNPYAP
jgi:serine/threonine-protein kinase